MQISAPCIITPRLLPGLQIGEATLSIEYGETTPDDRQGYIYHVDLPGYEYTGSDLASGVGGGSLQEGLASLLSFLGAFAESVQYAAGEDNGPENIDLFPEELQEWATENSDELSMTVYELEESETPIISE